MLSLLRDAELAGTGDDQVQRVLSLGVPPEARTPHSANDLADPLIELLSVRELEVLRLLDSALTAPEIARELFVSYNTVRTHIKHIFTKLDVTNRRAAVLRARERGVL